MSQAALKAIRDFKDSGECVVGVADSAKVESILKSWEAKFEKVILRDEIVKFEIVEEIYNEN